MRPRAPGMSRIRRCSDPRARASPRPFPFVLTRQIGAVNGLARRRAASARAPFAIKLDDQGAELAAFPLGDPVFFHEVVKERRQRAAAQRIGNSPEPAP